MGDVVIPPTGGIKELGSAQVLSGYAGAGGSSTTTIVDITGEGIAWVATANVSSDITLHVTIDGVTYDITPGVDSPSGFTIYGAYNDKYGMFQGLVRFKKELKITAENAGTTAYNIPYQVIYQLFGSKVIKKRNFTDPNGINVYEEWVYDTGAKAVFVKRVLKPAPPPPPDRIDKILDLVEKIAQKLGVS